MEDDAVPRPCPGSSEENGSLRARTPVRARARTPVNPPSRVVATPIVTARPRASLGRRKQRRFDNAHLLGVGAHGAGARPEDMVATPIYPPDRGAGASVFSELLQVAHADEFMSWRHGAESVSAPHPRRRRCPQLDALELSGASARACRQFMGLQYKLRRGLLSAWKSSSSRTFVQSLEVFLMAWVAQGSDFDSQYFVLHKYLHSFFISPTSGVCALKLRHSDHRALAHAVCQFHSLKASSTTDARDGVRCLCIRPSRPHPPSGLDAAPSPPDKASAAGDGGDRKADEERGPPRVCALLEKVCG